MVQNRPLWRLLAVEMQAQDDNHERIHAESPPQKKNQIWGLLEQFIGKLPPVLAIKVKALKVTSITEHTEKTPHIFQCKLSENFVSGLQEI